MTEQLYNLANLRELLTKGFDDVELRALCFEVPDFRPVFERLGQGIGRAQIVNELLEFAERQMLLDALLAFARERNPARYEEHGPYYVTDPIPILQNRVSGLTKQLATITSAEAGQKLGYEICRKHYPPVVMLAVDDYDLLWRCPQRGGKRDKRPGMLMM